MSVSDLIHEMRRNPLTDGLTLSGGEPFAQAAECYLLAKSAHDDGLDAWTYTGYTFEHLRDNGTAEQKALLQETDVLVDGSFILDQRSLSLPWRGSKNQRLIDVKKSLDSGNVVLYEKDKK